MPNTVRLAVEQSTDDPADICAMEILQYEDGSPKGGQEVVVERDEAAEFMADCTDWTWIVHEFQDTDGRTVGLTAADRYHQGYSVVLVMAEADWATWVEAYGVAEELDPDVVALLTAS